MRMHLYPREFAFVYTQKRKRSFLRAYVCVRAFVCVRLRACLRADLIKTQNAFARKIFQHSNALWVHKLSGCTIYMYFPKCCKSMKQDYKKMQAKQGAINDLSLDNIFSH